MISWFLTCTSNIEELNCSLISVKLIVHVGELFSMSVSSLAILLGSDKKSGFEARPNSLVSAAEFRAFFLLKMFFNVPSMGASLCDYWLRVDLKCLQPEIR